MSHLMCIDNHMAAGDPEDGRYTHDRDDDEQIEECAHCGDGIYPDFEKAIRIGKQAFHDTGCLSAALHAASDATAKSELGKLLAACEVLTTIEPCRIPELENFEAESVWAKDDLGNRKIYSLVEFRNIALAYRDLLAPMGTAPAWTEPVTIVADSMAVMAGTEANL